MRLLNTKTIVVESFPTPERPEIPDYAILSHRWEDQEASFQEIQEPGRELQKTKGYEKIKRCCDQAASVGFEYVWIDTCCIDKTNNAELTEALNSMFHWYRKAQVCYSYMSDVPSGDDPHASDSKFRKSRWFTRGWTLQELLAPLYVIFFGNDWKEIGTKSSLQKLISEITGITSQVLLTNYAGEISIAQRMAWASKRETARVEDKAYCLMGLFGVNMPMMYGEGENAFRRLQLEIMKLSDDHSIFAWTGDSQENRGGLLATSPKEFENCSNVRRHGDSTRTSAFSMTNKGLNIKLPLIPCESSSSENELFLGVLSCQRKEGEQYPDRHPLGIYLEKASKDGSNNHYSRVSTEKIEEIKTEFSSDEKTELYVADIDPSKFDVSNWMQYEPQYMFSIRNRPQGDPRVEYPDNLRAKWTIKKEEIRLLFGGSGHSGTLMFKNKKEQTFAVSMGVHNYNVWCDIAADCEQDIEKLAKEYWDGSRSGARWNNLDRRTIALSSGDSASLAIRKGRVDGKRAYLIEISAGGGFWLDRVGPGCCFPGW
ncbi:MAG: hypothetical protein M1813_000691 [Trichoglossum hirsutum]|jgi:hypothetical protein|nr:MAG: hypothetical protein M1813_000691 [Trichoglossum hirsutum]